MFLAQSRESKAVEGHRVVAMTFAVLVLAVLAAPRAEAAASEASAPEITGSIAPFEPPYEQREFIAKSGSETIELAARLREHGGLITLPVAWRLFRLIGATAGGEEVYRAEVPQAEVRVAPGDYRVEIGYGYAQYSRLITVDRERRLSLVFNLNTGAIRVLSRGPAPWGSSFTSAHRLYALSGDNRARLVAEDKTPGGLLRLPAGKYRVESALRPGNVTARAEVEVKPGVLSAVEFFHQAGAVRLAVSGRQRDSFAWQVLDANSQVAAEAHGASLAVILSPGRYRVRAVADAAEYSGEFSVVAGNDLAVLLSR